MRDLHIPDEMLLPFYERAAQMGLIADARDEGRRTLLDIYNNEFLIGTIAKNKNGKLQVVEVNSLGYYALEILNAFIDDEPTQLMQVIAKTKKQINNKQGDKI